MSSDRLQFDPQNLVNTTSIMRCRNLTRYRAEFSNHGIELTDVATKGENRTELCRQNHRSDVSRLSRYKRERTLSFSPKAGHDIVTHKTSYHMTATW